MYIHMEVKMIKIEKSLINFICQIEVFVFFVTGKFDKNEIYHDNILYIVWERLRSPGEFWFDAVTSIPWSFLDFLSYLVTHSQVCLVYLDTNPFHQLSIA